MESGWIVNFNDGSKVIMSEKAYKWFNDGACRNVRVTEHWFSLDDAIRKNPGVEILVM